VKISTVGLAKTFQDADRRLSVIQSLTIDFPAAALIAVVGRSGVGKSTLLHLLGGLERPSGGKVLYDEVDIFQMPDERLAVFRGRNVGFVFQFHHLLPEFDACENVAMPMIIAGCAEAESRARAVAMLERVGLKDRLTHRPGALSGGEQQRVAIARALVNKPRVILADEPTGNLDFATARQVQDLLLMVCREISSSLIIATHNLELARSLDAAYEMQPGGELKLL